LDGCKKIKTFIEGGFFFFEPFWAHLASKIPGSVTRPKSYFLIFPWGFKNRELHADFKG
jgi:hypothetical protein